MVDVTIKDPDGPAARVVDKMLLVKAVSQSALEDASAEKGQAFVYPISYLTTAANQEVMAITNDIKQHMHVDQVWVQSDIATIFKVGWQDKGTPAGTTLIGGPINDHLGETADTTAFGNAEVTGTIVLKPGFAYLGCPASTTPVKYDMEGAWVTGKSGTFVVSCVTDAATIQVTVIVHMDPIG